jgi:hypothetical protein
MNKGMFFWQCVVMALVGFFVFGFVTMVLWNWLVPVLFNGPAITYLQALGLLALSKILFWGGGKKYSYSGSSHQHNPYWKQRFQEKFSSLDPADREAFKRKMKEKWCRWEQDSNEQKSEPTSQS